MPLKKLPLPASSIALSFAILGNLLRSYHTLTYLGCGILSSFLILLLILKMIFFSSDCIQDLKQPIGASVFSTFFMALMILSGYLSEFSLDFGRILWFLAVFLHIIWIIYFTIGFMLPPSMEQVHASYFIVYVGIASAAVTSPVFEQVSLGRWILLFAFCCMIFLFPLLLRRYQKSPAPAPAQPLFCIFAAPVSLCLTGYLKCSQNPRKELILTALIFALLLYVIVLMKLPGFLKAGFYPSWASFTFPMSISAMAVKLSLGVLPKTPGIFAQVLGLLTPLMCVIAVLITLLVFFRYVCCMFTGKSPQS